jgi:flagellar biosynthesis/type III secretory pathway protein FliH
MIDFEPFAPIDALKKKHKSPLEEKEEEIRRLQQELEELRNQNRELKKTVESVKFALGSQIRRLEEEKKHLLEQISHLKTENETLKNELSKARELLENLQKDREVFLKLTEELKEKINQNLESLKHEILNLWEKVTLEALKELLNTDKLQNEDTLKKLFKEIFEDKLFLGEIEIRANPEDVPILREILSNKGGITFSIKPEPALKRGEVEVETDKFFVERKYDELIPQLLRETMEKILKKEEKET